MEIYDYLTQYYSNYDEEGRLLHRRSGQVEFASTMHYIRKYLQPDQCILEIGAGTGRYSVTLAGEGYDVTAVELVAHNLEILRSKVTPEMHITSMQGNALDLSFLPDESYDMTLLLGPLYHLYEETDKLKALSEAIRVTKRGGVIMAAYCISEGSIIQYAFKKGNLKKVLEEGLLSRETFETVSRPSELFEMVRKSDIDKMMVQLPVERLHYIATDGFGFFMQPELEAMDGETFETFLRYHLTVCENVDLVGATGHSLDIFRRK